MPYELIDHTADLGIRVCARDAAKLFVEAARAMFEQITDSRATLGACQEELEIEGADWPDLMVNWLRELLYLWSGRGLLVRQTVIRGISEVHLCAHLIADCYDPALHAIKMEIKAVTYHKIQVSSGPAGWEATVIFDL